MTIRLTPLAQRQLRLLRKTGFRGEGLLLGTILGKFLLVESLLPLSFNRDHLDKTLVAAVESLGRRVAGVFFANKRPFSHDWFRERVIMEIHRERVDFFRLECTRAETGTAGRPGKTKVHWVKLGRGNGRILN